MERLLTDAIDTLDQRFNADSDYPGLSTGFHVLDNMTLGLHPAELTVLAGRPSMGKTALALKIIENVIADTNKKALLFSMEMTRESLMFRILASMTGTDYSKIRSGRLEDEDWPKLTEAVNSLINRNLYIDDSAVLSPADIRARATHVRQEEELSLIVIDNLQQMRWSASIENRADEVSYISHSLKAIAKDFHVPVIALSQLNRSVEQRPNKRPILSDLRDSGAIEDIADVIIFVYRGELYDFDSPDRGFAEIIVGKQRNGPVGTVKLKFNKKQITFTDL